MRLDEDRERRIVTGDGPGEQVSGLGGSGHLCSLPSAADPPARALPEPGQASWLATPTTCPCGSASSPNVTPGTDVAGCTTRPPCAAAASRVAATSCTPTKNVTSGSPPCSGLMPPGTLPSTPEST